MIDLRQIDSTDKIKNLRTHLNTEATEINVAQPCIGMAVSPTIKFYKYPKRLLATCDPETIRNEMFLLCLPSNRNNRVYVAQAWGELVLTSAPTLAGGATELTDFDFIRIGFDAVKVPTRDTPFSGFYQGSVSNGNHSLSNKTSNMINAPEYPLGGNQLEITQTLASGPDTRYATYDAYAYVAADDSSCDIVITSNTVYTLL